MLGAGQSDRPLSEHIASVNEDRRPLHSLPKRQRAPAGALHNTRAPDVRILRPTLQEMVYKTSGPRVKNSHWSRLAGFTGTASPVTSQAWNQH